MIPLPYRIFNRAGEEALISQAAALVAGELMPVSPPLIGDTMFARVDMETRQQIFQVVEEKEDRQVLLFAIEPELEGSEISPLYRVDPNPGDMTSQIISLE